MSTLNLIKATFKQPALLIEARKKRGFHVFLYMILLSIILSLPVAFQSMGILNTLKSDGEKIVEKLPDFSIENNLLTTKEKDSGFIYQTDSMIFTFDPEGKRSKPEIEADATNGVLTIALLKDEAMVVLPTVGSTADVLDSNVFSLPYSTAQLNNLNKTVVTNMLTEKAQNTILFGVVLLTSMFIIFLSFLFDLVVMTFFASLFTKLRMVNLKFSEVFKILVYCSTLPTLFSVLIQFVLPGLGLGSLGLALTLIIYFNIFPKPVKPKKK
ncbi:DUF1189 domain-containing protein [Vagococcus sp. DIV0080]|uniref:DUF1189 domain-containing protein n=1 Tax=Candidatus Vagococcus giribetii TaxID=2230876 RepID=A0ABS3HQ30_9ENTE|nr:DUF1189 domain-containing protein [Vagococcus sp. DIV0080]MBO0475849.1 DUF1189 domain-containing protein [Vagococcus sp. DIV0080]